MTQQLIPLPAHQLYMIRFSAKLSCIASEVSHILLVIFILSVGLNSIRSHSTLKSVRWFIVCISDITSKLVNPLSNSTRIQCLFVLFAIIFYNLSVVLQVMPLPAHQLTTIVCIVLIRLSSLCSVGKYLFTGICW